MSERTTPPFRADHVGSLLRPPEVKAARERFAAGEIDAEALREVEDQAIASAVAMQEEVGLRLATDGELRRQSWHMDFIYQLGGIVQAPADVQAVPFHTLDGETNRLLAGLASRRGPRLARAHDLRGGLRGAGPMTTTAMPKQTIPS